MIEVEGLSKVYGGSRAVRDVSFKVEKGEIIGFLGPNGAGKTTTMRILTCFMAPTSGTARIAGFDILENSLEVRRHIGYLPETAPLYPEMTVRDYLLYVAALKGVPKSKRAERLEAALDAGRLEERADSLIRKLSKGYRQRVGIAQAVIHDPPVLIMDEPSSGLDPRQRAETRSFIKSLAKDHTIILSTHILPDVQETCSRVVIINQGQVVAQDEVANLEAGRGGIQLSLKRPTPDAREKLTRVAGIAKVTTDGHGIFSVDVKGGDDPREDIANLCVNENWGLLELSRRRANLEEVFLQLTTTDK